MKADDGGSEKELAHRRERPEPGHRAESEKSAREKTRADEPVRGVGIGPDGMLGEPDQGERVDEIQRPHPEAVTDDPLARPPGQEGQGDDSHRRDARLWKPLARFEREEHQALGGEQEDLRQGRQFVEWNQVDRKGEGYRREGQGGGQSAFAQFRDHGESDQAERQRAIIGGDRGEVPLREMLKLLGLPDLPGFPGVEEQDGGADSGEHPGMMRVDFDFPAEKKQAKKAATPAAILRMSREEKPSRNVSRSSHTPRETPEVTAMRPRVKTARPWARKAFPTGSNEARLATIHMARKAAPIQKRVQPGAYPESHAASVNKTVKAPLFRLRNEIRLGKRVGIRAAPLKRSHAVMR